MGFERNFLYASSVLVLVGYLLCVFRRGGWHGVFIIEDKIMYGQLKDRTSDCTKCVKFT